jgi:hypothetical protein
MADKHVNSARIVVKPHPGSDGSGACDARVRALIFAFNCHAKKNPAAGPSERGKHDGTHKEDSADARIIPE